MLHSLAGQQSLCTMQQVECASARAVLVPEAMQDCLSRCNAKSMGANPIQHGKQQEGRGGGGGREREGARFIPAQCFPVQASVPLAASCCPTGRCLLDLKSPRQAQ